MKMKKGIMVAVLACSSLFVTSCYEAYPAYGGVAVGMGPGGVGVSASAEWTNASYDADGYPIYGYSYGRPVYGYTAAGVAIFTLAALTTAYYLPYWGCAHWCHHHDVYIHYCPHHHHKCWAPPRCPRGHMPHVRPPHDGPHPGKGVHVKAPSHRGVPDSGRPPQQMQGGPNHGMQGGPNRGMQGGPNHGMQGGPNRGMQGGNMQGGPNRGMQPGNVQGGSNRGMQPVRNSNMRPNIQPMQGNMQRGGMNNGMQRPSRIQSASTPSANIRNYGPGGGARTSFGGGNRPSSPSFGGGSRPSSPSFGGGSGSRYNSSTSFGGGSGGGHRGGGFGGGGFGGGGHHGRR